MLMRREWSRYVDLLRDDLWKNHPQIHIVDFDFYDVEAFNQCENNNCVLMAIEILPVEWSYGIPIGLLHSPKPSLTVKQFLNAVEKVGWAICIVVLFYFPLPDEYSVNDGYFLLLFSSVFLGDGINILLNKKDLLTKKYQGNISYVFLKIGIFIDFLVGPPLMIYAVIDLLAHRFYVVE